MCIRNTTKGNRLRNPISLHGMVILCCPILVMPYIISYITYIWLLCIMFGYCLVCDMKDCIERLVLKLYDACLLCSWMSSAECVSYMALLSYYINNSYNYSFYCRLTNGTQNQQIISSRATSFPCEENLNSLAMLLDTIKSPKHCWKRRIELHGGQHQQLYLSCFSNDHCKSWLDMIIINHFYDLNL